MATPRRPNILFFFTDDQRFDTLRALGNPHIVTPTMDWLAANGTAFTHAHIMGGSCGAVCMPSRAMLNTGRTLYRIQDCGQQVPGEHVLLGEALRQTGYATFGTGKWHNGRSAYARSFSDGDEIFFGGMNDHWNVPAYHFDPTGKYEGRLPFCENWALSNTVKQREGDHVTAGKHSSELFCDATIAFLNRHDFRQPFFGYVAFMAPHDPRTMPKPYLEMYDPERIPLTANVMGGHPFDNGELHIRDEQLEKWPRTPEAIRRHLAEYYAMITHADANMGRVLDVLRAKGQLDNTVIVFSGDNGLALGQHGLMGKQSLYDHSVRVPLVFAGPGVPRGERRDAYAYLLDIFPTLCELTGVPVPDSVEGRSLVPVLRSPQATVRETLHLAYRHLHRGVRDRRFKLIEYVVDGRRTTQLFDLVADPCELRNLAAAPGYHQDLERLRKELRRWRDELGDDRAGQGADFWRGYDAGTGQSA
ncbi:MAG: hypothetical protein A3K18_29905 [Lentisphaerae bacterium RIFOXYA12_64_32]|nr:MAG: hypothetical protein A3K18_29905 [Lentisphaerae bacterium RIFOXYA12_64_32]